MFWLPEGWVPYYAEWLLSFPRAPLGSISIQAWFVACGAVILLASDAILATIKLLVEATARQPQKSKGNPIKFAGEKATAGRKSAEGKDGKKEL
jgi:tail-anchored protein insertion receptor